MVQMQSKLFKVIFRVSCRLDFNAMQTHAIPCFSAWFQNIFRLFFYSYRTSQAKCLFDHGQADPTLDHGAEMIYPGERFDADQQCKPLIHSWREHLFFAYAYAWNQINLQLKFTHWTEGMLKYGKDSIRSRAQPLKEICRDLHCQRDRYTWTSHPALEGTNCAESKVSIHHRSATNHFWMINNGFFSHQIEVLTILVGFNYQVPFKWIMFFVCHFSFQSGVEAVFAFWKQLHSKNIRPLQSH